MEKLSNWFDVGLLVLLFKLTNFQSHRNIFFLQLKNNILVRSTSIERNTGEGHCRWRMYHRPTAIESNRCAGNGYRRWRRRYHHELCRNAKRTSPRIKLLLSASETLQRMLHAWRIYVLISLKAILRGLPFLLVETSFLIRPGKCGAFSRSVVNWTVPPRLTAQISTLRSVKIIPAITSVSVDDFY